MREARHEVGGESGLRLNQETAPQLQSQSHHSRKPFAHGMPLSLVIARYFAYIVAGLGAVWLAAFTLLSVAMNMGAVYPANYGAAHINEAAQELKAQDEFDAAAIPTAYRYARFNAEGTMLSSNLPGKKLVGTWDVASALLGEGDPRFENNAEAPGDSPADKPASFDQASSTQEAGDQTTAETAESNNMGDNGQDEIPITGVNATTYAAFELADGTICLLATEYLPQYASPELRDNLPNPQDLMVWGACAGSVAVVALVARRASRVITRKLEPLTHAAQRIAHEDLEFQVGSSNVRQVNDVLDAMERMRASLKDSLEARWRTEQAQRDQIAALAHDLKTPLTVVRANVEYLAETVADSAATAQDDDLLAAARDANEAAEKLDTHVRLLVEASRGESDAGIMEPFGADKAADALAHEAETFARTAGITLRVVKAPEIVLYQASINQQSFNRAIMNVVSNAFDHAQSEVSVAFGIEGSALSATNPTLVVTVTDDGPGFSPQALEHGCERFFRGDASRKGAASGEHYGLGLFTAAETIRAHGGELTLENETDSTAHTTGARVIARIPVCSRQPPTGR